MLKLELLLNKDGSCTVLGPTGHYRSCPGIHQLPSTVQKVIEDYIQHLQEKVNQPAPIADEPQ